MVVVERLSAARLRDAKSEERTNNFFVDPQIPANGRAELSEYRCQQPAVDRGHLARAADSPDQHFMSYFWALKEQGRGLELLPFRCRKGNLSRIR